RVEAIHIEPVPASFAARGEIACVARGAGSGGEKIRIERNHDIGGIEFVAGVHRPSEDRLRSGARGVRSRRIELMPLRRGKFAKNSLNLRGQRWGGNGFGQNAETIAVPRDQRIDSRDPSGLKSFPALWRTQIGDVFGAIRIVEIHEAGLREYAGGA